MRFHLDEHVSNAVAAGLRQRGIDVTSTHETGLRGAVDVAHLEFARINGRVIVTHDADFLRLDAQGMSHFGIVYCAQQKHKVGDLVRLLVLLDELYANEDFLSTVQFL
jgi:predicted nuclease of predicted toxin-antitoxin system